VTYTRFAVRHRNLTKAVDKFAFWVHWHVWTICILLWNDENVLKREWKYNYLLINKSTKRSKQECHKNFKFKLPITNNYTINIYLLFLKKTRFLTSCCAVENCLFLNRKNNSPMKTPRKTIMRFRISLRWFHMKSDRHRSASYNYKTHS